MPSGEDAAGVAEADDEIADLRRAAVGEGERLERGRRVQQAEKRDVEVARPADDLGVVGRSEAVEGQRHVQSGAAVGDVRARDEEHLAVAVQSEAGARRRAVAHADRLEQREGRHRRFHGLAHEGPVEACARPTPRDRDATDPPCAERGATHCDHYEQPHRRGEGAH